MIHLHVNSGPAFHWSRWLPSVAFIYGVLALAGWAVIHYMKGCAR